MRRFPRNVRYASEAQVNYLRRLNNRTMSLRVEGYNIRDWDHILPEDASKMIDTLKTRLEAAAKAQGLTSIW